jgi:tripartite ATP-independent transporter DctM subunit
MITISLIILIALFIVLIFLGTPVPFALAFSSLVVFVIDPRLSPWLLTSRTFSGVNSFILIAIPLFLLTGLAMNRSGITKVLIDLCNIIVGRIRGGLAHVNVLVSMFFAGISGASQADTAGVGSVLIPAMTDRGYGKAFTVAVTAASSTMGNIIPPSIIAVIYGATCNVSVGAIFIAGILPGVAIGISQMGLCYIFAVKHDYPIESRPPLNEAMRTIRNSILPLLTPVIIIGGIISGFFTPTESAVVACVYTLILAFFIYKKISFPDLLDLFVETAEITSLVVFTIGVANSFGYIIGFYQVSNSIEVLFLKINSPLPFLMSVIILLVIVGTFMDAAPAIIIIMPILAPVAAKVGVHPVHLGVVAVMTLALGLITPPYGLSLLLASKIGNIGVDEAFRVAIIFAVTMLSIIILSAIFPEVVLFLPLKMIPNMV